MVLHLFISSLFIDDLIDKEFMFALNENRVWRVEGLIREELVVVLEEWADFDIVLSSAPEVTSSYVTTWVRVGVNRAQALYDTVVSSGFHTLLFVSIEFWTMHSAYFSRFLYASVRFRLLL